MTTEILSSPYRAATPRDAEAMAELVNIAGEGLPLHLWTKMAGEGESPWEVGRQRAQRKSGGFSYCNTIVHEEDNSVVAALIGYPLPDAPEPVDYRELPEMFVPLQQLEDLVPGTWYINVLAAYPKHRGKGYGTGLLTVAEEIAAQEGCRGLSLIVSDGNPRARQLYMRSGYQEITSRTMVKGSWENAGENWVLLRKAL
ncbi:MAG: GNAT family N-acetyltransferase [Gammaproteobacteria bacterium]|nr:GNAT family N-acetyltransferase [Gammaproteobacteria bacterium]